jgi:hypothetical protein
METGDDEEKFSKMMALEISDQRKNIKTAKDEFLKKKAMEEEKARVKKGKENANF